MSSPFDFTEPAAEEADYSPSRRSGEPPRTRLVYILLAIFLGGLGVHNFYAGRWTIGLAQLIGVPIITIILAVGTVLTGGLGALILIPFLIAVGVWLLGEIVLVKKDGRGKWMA
jgi:hypothetical protein